MFQEIDEEIRSLVRQNHRIGQNVTIVAASKMKSMQSIFDVYTQGARHFGENYVQEGVKKIDAAKELGMEDLVWHLIGPLQSNKAKIAAEYFDWIDTVASLRLARALNRHREAIVQHGGQPLQVCVQVNIDNAASKHGLVSDSLESIDLIQLIDELPWINVRGIMVMPDPASEAALTSAFHASRALFDQIKESLPQARKNYFDTLSMGMSSDYRLAVSAGSTMVRIGTALFGERDHH